MAGFIPLLPSASGSVSSGREAEANDRIGVGIALLSKQKQFEANLIPFIYTKLGTLCASKDICD
jgi:hypothetical protein